jgi:hypothetical protein
MPEFARRINIEMDWLDEESFEIRGQLDDNVHSLTANLKVGFPGFAIKEATAEITRMPYPGYCTGASGAIHGLVGASIGRGFRKRVAEVLGGAESCNHLHTLVNDMVVSAFQMNYLAAKRRPDSARAIRDLEGDHSRRRQLVLAWMPKLRNTCYIFSEKNDHLFEGSGEGPEPTRES